MNFKKPLSLKEEQELLKRAKTDPAAKEKLVIHNLKLVYYFAGKYATNKRTEIDDLFQIGVIGLMKAIDMYDIKKTNGAKFSTYAAFWIKQKIMRDRFLFTDDDSLDRPIGQETETTLGDIIEDRSNIPIEEQVEHRVFIQQLKAEAKKLLELIEYETLALYYGLSGSEYNLKEIAEKYNCTPEYIRRKKENALRKLRRSMFIRGINSHIDRNTVYLSSVDYSRNERQRMSVEDIVIRREQLRQKLIMIYGEYLEL